MNKLRNNPWFRVLRVPNLLIIAFVFAVFRYAFLDKIGVGVALNEINYFLLMMSVILIAAGGNIINDIYDIRIDHVNRPGTNPIRTEIDEKTARIVFWILSVVGVALGYFISYLVQFPSLGSIHLISFFLLWMYNSDFKHRAVYGNLMVGFLSATMIILIPVFDFIPANKGSLDTYMGLYLIYVAYALFAFFMSWAREMMKDLEDIKGDKKHGSRTFAVSYSLNANKNFIFIILLIVLFGLGAVFYLFWGKALQMTYIIGFLILPLLYTIYLMFKANNKEDWAKCSLLMKAIMLVGISSIGVFTVVG